MVPAQECFEAGDVAVLEIELRLIVELELAIAQGNAHVVLELVARTHALVHLALEEAGVAGAVDLGAAERQVGVLQQLVGLGAVDRTDGDADAGRDGDRMLVDIE